MNNDEKFEGHKAYIWTIACVAALGGLLFG